MTAVQKDGKWFVMHADIVAGPFDTSSEAWRWIDRHEGEPISRSERVSQWVFDKDDPRGAA